MTSQLENLTAFGNWNLPLSIQRRGHFFTDDGFQDYRSHFESAAKDLLQEFELSRSEKNPFKSYRTLRDRQFSVTDKAAKVAEESDKYKIVMDVEGFRDGDLKVTISGPNELEVEGCQEVAQESAFFNRSFKRRFSLPGSALVRDASSVLSSDNVLTVTIPKKVREITSSEQTTSCPLQDTSESRTLESKVQEVFQKLKEDSKSAFALNEFHKRSSLDSSTLLDLQIVPKQSFFNDSYFENVRHTFQKSIEDLMKKRRERISSAPDRELFQKVRTTKEENTQAVSVTEDAKEHKIVLDVHGFSEGDLKVRAVSEHELVVEGKVEKKTQYTSCGHTFSRKFVLPHNVNIRQSTSALSSEGILTIIVPKRLEAIDYTIPVKSEAATVLSNIIKKEQERETSSINVHRIPVVQEEEKILNVQQNVQQQSQSGKNVTSTKSVSSTETTDCNTSQTTDQRTQFVPINLEGNQSLNVKEETKNTNYIVAEPSNVVKESQKLVSESSKLIESINSSEKRQPNEHFVPVELDSGIKINPNNTATRTTVNMEQSTSLGGDVSSINSHQCNPQQRLSEPFKVTPSGARVIPISLKGSFYNESIFDDARQNIDKEVQDVFSKYRKTSVVDEQKENTTVQKISTQDATSHVKNGQGTSTILDDAHNYKIVLDVFGFEERDMKVKVSGINEISIEGNVEKSKGGTISKQSFQRTFQLPDCVDLERTFTALSEEGILTVTVPKKNQLLLLGKYASPSKSKLHNTSATQEEKATLVIDSSGIVQEKRSNTKQTHGLESTDSSSTISSSVPLSPTSSITSESIGRNREYIVPVAIEDVSDLTSEAGSVRSVSTVGSQTTTASATSKNVPHNILSTSTSASSIDSQIQSKSATLTGETALQVDSEISGKTSTMASAHDQSRDIVTKPLFNLPIVPRGHFFDDIFFQDSRSMYESLLRSKMNRFNRSTSFVDDLGFFKSLRDRRITGGNQVATLSEDDQFNKIVLDVHGFDEKNLRVKAVSESELLIEGELEERTGGGSLSRKKFRKQFLLPGNVDLRAASSALSSDGVLTIKVPKKL